MMKKLISLFLIISLLLTAAYAEEAAKENTVPVFTADEIVDAGNAALEAGDYAKALAYYALAAERESARALNNLGTLYEQWTGKSPHPFRDQWNTITSSAIHCGKAGCIRFV